MNNEEIATAETAAALSRHFAGAMQAPAGGGIIATSSGIRQFPDSAAFEAALAEEAARGIAEASDEDAEEVDNRTPLEKARVSAYAAKLERRRRQAAKEAEREEAEERRRAAFIQKARDEARNRVRELRNMAETASAIESAIAASRKEALDPEAAHRRPQRIVVLSLKHWRK
jgi:hypothetical protein